MDITQQQLAKKVRKQVTEKPFTSKWKKEM